jgi:heme exporter protein D
MSGVVQGGMEFVWAAYGITFGALAIYGVTLITRLREQASRNTSERSGQ